jgi:hypothetical protein
MAAAPRAGSNAPSDAALSALFGTAQEQVGRGARGFRGAERGWPRGVLRAAAPASAGAAVGPAGPAPRDPSPRPAPPAQVAEVQARVTGSIPTWLKGSLVVNGGAAAAGTRPGG